MQATPGNVGGKLCLTDGHTVIGRHSVYILELKNETGSTSSEPSLQALAYYDMFLREGKLWRATTTCQPCMIVFVVGPYMGFAGCAVTERATLDIFSVLALDFDSANHDAYEKLARHIAALKKAYAALYVYYTEMDGGPTSPATAFIVTQTFPYPTTYRQSTTLAERSFVYGEKMTGRCLFFQGMSETGEAICVKIVQRYDERVHAWFAERGFAPKLITVQVVGEWS